MRIDGNALGHVILSAFLFVGIILPESGAEGDEVLILFIVIFFIGMWFINSMSRLFVYDTSKNGGTKK